MGFSENLLLQSLPAGERATQNRPGLGAGLGVALGPSPPAAWVSSRHCAKCKSPNRPNLQDLFMALPLEPASALPPVPVQAVTNEPLPRLQGRGRRPQHSRGGCRNLQTYSAKPDQRLGAATRRLARSESGSDSGRARRATQIPHWVPETPAPGCAKFLLEFEKVHLPFVFDPGPIYPTFIPWPLGSSKVMSVQRHDRHPGSEPLQGCLDKGINKAHCGLFPGVPPLKGSTPLSLRSKVPSPWAHPFRGRVLTGKVEEAGTSFGAASEAWTPPPSFLTPWAWPLHAL